MFWKRRQESQIEELAELLESLGEYAHDTYGVLEMIAGVLQTMDAGITELNERLEVIQASVKEKADEISEQEAEILWEMENERAQKRHDEMVDAMEDNREEFGL